jgi:hypothetical protein
MFKHLFDLIQTNWYYCNAIFTAQKNTYPNPKQK